MSNPADVIGKREIKFRGWDNETNKMGFTFDGVTTNGDVISTAICCETGQTIYERRDITVMQYTGLKDKNGKEIYEGDIVRSSHTGCMAVVIIKNGAMRYAFLEWNSKKQYPAITYRRGVDRVFEVIGNIFENPDLLKK